jgi:hypothetical protein
VLAFEEHRQAMFKPLFTRLMLPSQLFDHSLQFGWVIGKRFDVRIGQRWGLG